MRIVGLGRRFVPDDRDKKFQLSNLLPLERSSDRKHRYWNEGQKFDQGDQPSCVGHAFTHYFVNGPIKPAKNFKPDPFGYYLRCKEVDEWEGTDYDGTSLRAGAKIAKADGHIENYYWGKNFDDLIYTLLEVGPVVVGSPWFRGLSFPDKNNFITPTGPEDDGHAYLLNGINVEEEKIRMEQSWYPTWGDSGNAWFRFNEFYKILAMDHTELLIATEVKNAGG